MIRPPVFGIGQRVLFEGWYKRAAGGKILTLTPGFRGTGIRALVQWDDSINPEWTQTEFLIPEG